MDAQRFAVYYQSALRKMKSACINESTVTLTGPENAAIVRAIVILTESAKKNHG